MSRGRTIVFIDNANIFYGQLNAGWRIDFQRLHAHVEDGGEVWQTFFFASVTDPPRYRQTGFYNFLSRDMRYEVKLYSLGRKSVRCRSCGERWVTRVEKGVDVGLATKMLTLANNRAFDTAILVAADRDYLETVEAVKANGLRVEIMAWRGTISPEMEEASSEAVVYFDDVQGDLELTTAPDTEVDQLTSGDEEE